MSKTQNIKLQNVGKEAMDNIELIKIKTNELIFALGLATQKGNTEFDKRLNKNIEIAKQGVLDLSINIISNYSVKKNHELKTIN